MKKKLYIYVLAFAVFLVGLYFLGTRIIGVVGTILVALGIGKIKKNGLDEAKKNIDKAGEDIEAKQYDADSALEFFDDFFSDSDGG